MASKKPKRAPQQERALRSPPALTPFQCLKSVQGALDATFHAIEDFTAATERSRQTTAVRNFLSNARSVTFILQNLRSTDPNFDGWYAPIQAELKADPLANFFNDERRLSEHLLTPELVDWQTGTVERHFDAGTTLEPVVGSENGRLVAALRITFPDGTTELVPADRSALSLERIPLAFRGKPLQDLMQQHAENLRSIVGRARIHLLAGRD